MALIPDGTYIIQSTLLPELVADLAGGGLDNPIIGFPIHRGLNQRVCVFLKKNEFV
jgi:hypothetical protein